MSRSLVSHLLKHRKWFFVKYPQKLLLYPPIRKVFTYTMQSYPSLCQVHDFIYNIERQNLEGDVVEIGCWKGGCTAFMGWTIKRYGGTRKVWAFDSFKGLPEQTKEDWGVWGSRRAIKKGKKGAFHARAEDVQRISHRMAADVNVVPGFIEDTIPAASIEKIALLRIDVDLYEPTKHSLELLYDCVVDGGYVIFDDYASWVGSRQAIYEFFVERKIYPNIMSCAYGPAFFRKRSEQERSKGIIGSGAEPDEIGVSVRN